MTRTCKHCSETIERNTVGGWFNPGRAAAGAGYYSALCPGGEHDHAPEERGVWVNVERRAFDRQ